jgi:hypothetical protein
LQNNSKTLLKEKGRNGKRKNCKRKSSGLLTGGMKHSSLCLKTSLKVVSQEKSGQSLGRG